jgi:hypothetical protein
MTTTNADVPDLKPRDDVQRVLLSTTSRFYGVYESDDVRIDHAWPGFGSDGAHHRWTDGPTSRSTYVLSFHAPGPERRPGVAMPEYSGAGDFAASTLGVLFGKRIEAHGALENCGMFRMPDVAVFATTCFPGLPHNTHQVRADIPIPLNLVEGRRLAGLWNDEDLEDKAAFAGFTAAARFYQRALVAADRDPEIAYLHLITAGEVLSQTFLPKDDDRLLDDVLEADLARVTAALDDGGAVVRNLRRRLFEVKRRYVTTFADLVDDAFFDRREATETWSAFRKADFRAAMGAAYDLRSHNLHRGELVGHWMRSMHGNNEIQLGRPVVADQGMARVLAEAPTLIGLERVTRYALLRFAEARLGVDLTIAPPEDAG